MKNIRNMILRAIMICVIAMVTMLTFGHVGVEADIASGTSGTCSWVIDDNGVLTFRPTDGVSGQLDSSPNRNDNYGPFYNYRTQITKVVVENGVKTGEGCYKLFYGFSHCAEMDLRGLDTSAATDMQYMFYSCYGLTSLDVSGINTENVTNMSSMFYYCKSLTSLDVSGFNTENVTDISFMFSDCSSLTTLDLSGINTENVTNMQYMFRNCKGFTTLNLSGFKTGNVTNMSSMFFGCSGLTSLDVSGWNTKNVTYMSSMFSGCSGLTSLDVSGWDTRKVTNMDSMFYGCSGLRTLDVSGFKTGNVTNMSSMLSGCSGLTSLDISDWDTGNVTRMYQMFYNCSGLTSLDVSGLGTGKVTSMYEMFCNCSGLTSLDVSGFTTGNVTNMFEMFSGCSGLTSLDVSGFDTRKVTNMGKMFYNCQKLSSIKLGENFSFIGKNITIYANQAVLPTPPTSITTGKWIREDEAYGPFADYELKSQYGNNAAAWAGTWIWQVKSNIAIINFNANGGYTSTTNVTQQNNVSPVAFPAATRPSYELLSWNTAVDGSGTEYSLSDTVMPVLGKTIMLYAQWRKATTYTVRYHKQNTDLQNYTLAESETYNSSPGKTEEAELKEYPGYITPQPQTITVEDNDASIVDYYYDRITYTIHFDGNEATSGEMEDQQLIGDLADRLYDNKYKRTGYIFTGWNSKADGSGVTYGDAQTIKNLANNNETKILYAKWLEVPSVQDYEYKDGVYRFSLKAGETATIPSLPAGVHYEIKEVANPTGWEEINETSTSGTISSNETSKAVVTNGYNANGTALIEAHKTMTIGDPEAGAFTFELLENGRVIQRATNGTLDLAERILDTDGETTIKNPCYGMSVIRFENLEYTLDDVGMHTYKIREINGGDSSIQYDSHTETVYVEVIDNRDGTLATDVSYDSDGAVFTNSRIPVFETQETGDLCISKIIPQGANGEQFEFSIHMEDANGTPIAQSYPADIVKTSGRNNYGEWHMLTKTAVSHTQNLDDLGIQKGNYGGNWKNNHIRGTGRESANSNAHVVTIPGAESLHITIVYGGEGATCDWVCMWQGNHPEYTAYRNYYSSLTGKLGGGNHTSTSNTKEYDVSGDTVTFSYKSDGSGYGDGYGYYALITAEVAEFTPNSN